jgi:hypothetical protein
MLRHPVAVEAEPLGITSHVQGVAESRGSVVSFDDGGEVEDGERDHLADMGSRPACATIRSFP